MDFKMVAPSFVTIISPRPIGCKILSIPLGPRVVFTRSPSAMAPTKEDYFVSIRQNPHAANLKKKKTTGPVLYKPNAHFRHALRKPPPEGFASGQDQT